MIIELPFVVIDLTFLEVLLSKLLFASNPFEMAWVLLVDFYGWIFLLIGLYHAYFKPQWINARQEQYFEKQEFVLLAIDVPRDNETAIKAMEEFFIHLLGAHGSFTKWEKYWEGKFQLWFSLEIVSIDGYIQFLIRTPKPMRDLVEGGIYAQYPDAEITEVEDYVEAVPSYYPDEKYNLWGVDFTLDNGSYYPIKTYDMFEDRMTQTFIDPMAALLESMSKIGKGEQIWLQLLIQPEGVDWADKGKEELAKLKGDVKKKSKGLGSLIAKEGQFLMDELLTTEGGATAEEKEESGPSALIAMTPGERDRLKLLENKISKLAFTCKLRFVYVAEHEAMNKAHAINPVIGAIKQWNVLGVNGFKPALRQTGTRANYFNVKNRIRYRQNVMVKNYKHRLLHTGADVFKLNVEELASIWHFPSMYVKTALVQSAEMKKAQAPTILPFEIPETEEGGDATETQEEVFVPSGTLEVTHTTEPTFDYDNDYFEDRFAKVKSVPQKPSSAPTTEGETEERIQKPVQKQVRAPQPKKELQRQPHDAPVGEETPPQNLPFV